MADPFLVPGPIQKGYTDAEPILQGSDVSGVALIENIQYANGNLIIPYTNALGVTSSVSIPIDVNASIGITKGFCAEEAVANDNRVTAYRLAQAARDANVGTNEVVDSPRTGALIKYTAPAKENEANEEAWRRPFVVIPSAFNSNLIFLRNLVENVTDDWLSIGGFTENNVHKTLWVGATPVEAGTIFNILLRSFL